MESGYPHAPVVLVCDDTDSIRHLIRVNLEAEGYGVVETVDGAAAVARLLDPSVPRPSLILLDAAMGPYDGWWALDRIRSEAALDGIPIIMVTASVPHHDPDQARTAGCNAFLSKPFDPDTLLDLVVRFVGEPGPSPVGP